MTIESMDEGLNARLVEVTNVARRLTGFLSEHHELWINEAKAVNDDLSLDTLDGVNDEGDGPLIEGLEGALGINVCGGKPAAKARVGM
eukprot:scaffold559185_cov55-Attheya_sp.AAC.1